MKIADSVRLAIPKHDELRTDRFNELTLLFFSLLRSLCQCDDGGSFWFAQDIV